ncbi:hypothetical protein [uncultured Helicobacter sp.]
MKILSKSKLSSTSLPKATFWRLGGVEATSNTAESKQKQALDSRYAQN